MYLMSLIKSPFNYTGGKYKLLPQILPHFPQDINTFVDLFCGGCDVSLNVQAKRIIANDINPHIAAIFNEFKRVGIDFALQFIDNRIAGCHLTDRGKEAYLAFREEFNFGAQRPLDLFVLLAFCFNNQLRFSRKGRFNSAVGKRGFNQRMRQNLINTFERLDGITFTTKAFQDFNLSSLRAGDYVYADPPYTGTCAVYNDGMGWSIEDDKALMSVLDGLHERNVRFSLSNIHNDLMHNWALEHGYKVHFLNKDYSNCSYQRKAKEVQEVLITNENHRHGQRVDSGNLPH